MSISEAYTKIDQQFDSFCDASNNTSQTITLTGNTFIMTDDCQQTFVNKATVRANCEMNDITQNIAQFLSTTEFAREIADEDALKACPDASTPECTATLTESVKKKLRSACSAHNDATQAFTMTDSVIMCDSKTDAVWGNEMDVRSSCLKQQVKDAQTAIEKRTGNGNGNVGIIWLVIGLGLFGCCSVMTVIFIVILANKKKS